MRKIKGLILKNKNKRLQVELLEDNYGKKFFSVRTKKLIDFKKRHIHRTELSCSVETFVGIIEASHWFLKYPEVENKILLKDLAKVNKFNIITDLDV